MMLLDKGLIPCRKNVMGIGLKNDYTWGGGWYWPSHPIAGSMDNRDLFRAIIEAYKSEFKPLTLKGFDSSKWTDARSALIRDRANLGRVLDAIRYYDPGEHDENKFVTAKQVIARLADRDFSASVVLTGTKEANLDKYTKRVRPKATLPLSGNAYFQGKAQDGSHPGERGMISSIKNSVTFHLTKLIIGNNSFPSYILAIKFPQENYLVERNITKEILLKKTYELHSTIKQKIHT